MAEDRVTLAEADAIEHVAQRLGVPGGSQRNPKIFGTLPSALGSCTYGCRGSSEKIMSGERQQELCSS